MVTSEKLELFNKITDVFQADRKEHPTWIDIMRIQNIHLNIIKLEFLTQQAVDNMCFGEREIGIMHRAHPLLDDSFCTALVPQRIREYAANLHVIIMA
jgi:hypothetical protein